MTTIELLINIIIILLLVPAIYYAIKLNYSLTKLDKNQQEMMELAQALKDAVEKVEKFDNQSGSTDKSTFISPNSPQNKSDNIENDTPSEAELELLQALRSIK